METLREICRKINTSQIKTSDENIIGVISYLSQLSLDPPYQGYIYQKNFKVTYDSYWFELSEFPFLNLVSTFKVIFEDGFDLNFIIEIVSKLISKGICLNYYLWLEKQGL